LLLNDHAAKAICLGTASAKQIPLHNQASAGRVRRKIAAGPAESMNGARLIKSGLTRIGVWFALVGVTVLLTVLFSFLGNLSVAVVTGLVLGSARRWRWHAVPVSIVFPAVVLGLSHYFKSELPPGKVHLIAVVCGAAFWGVYGMSFCLHIFEQKAPVPPAMAKGLVVVPGSSSERASGTAARGFTLATLCGSWACKDITADGSTRHKTLRIEDGKFALTVREPDGRQRELARGEVNVGQLKADTPVVTLHPKTDS
jgi:hypothetical protein